METSAILVDNPQLKVNEFFLCKRAADLLHSAYPLHLWGVAIDRGFLDIRNLYLSGDWGYRLRVTDQYSSSSFDHKIKMAGGEILERYRQRRAKADEASMHALPTNFAGRHTADM